MERRQLQRGIASRESRSFIHRASHSTTRKPKADSGSPERLVECLVNSRCNPAVHFSTGTIAIIGAKPGSLQLLNFSAGLGNIATMELSPMDPVLESRSAASLPDRRILLCGGFHSRCLARNREIESRRRSLAEVIRIFFFEYIHKVKLDNKLDNCRRSYCHTLDPESGNTTKAPPLPIALDANQMIVHDSDVYSVGGRTADGRESSRVFRLRDDRWKDMTPLWFPLSWPAVAISNDSLFVLGGMYQGVPQAIVESLNLTSGTWSLGPKIPSTGGRSGVYGAAATEYKGRIYVCGGSNWDENTALSHCHRFSSETRAWESGEVLVLGGGRLLCRHWLHRCRLASGAPTMRVPRLRGSLLKVEGRLYAAGGSRSGSVERLSEDETEWELVPGQLEDDLSVQYVVLQ